MGVSISDAPVAWQQLESTGREFPKPQVLGARLVDPRRTKGNTPGKRPKSTLTASSWPRPPSLARSGQFTLSLVGEKPTGVLFLASVGFFSLAGPSEFFGSRCGGGQGRRGSRAVGTATRITPPAAADAPKNRVAFCAPRVYFPAPEKSPQRSAVLPAAAGRKVCLEFRQIDERFGR